MYRYASIMAFTSSTGLWEDGKDATNIDLFFIGALIDYHSAVEW